MSTKHNAGAAKQEVVIVCRQGCLFGSIAWRSGLAPNSQHLLLYNRQLTSRAHMRGRQDEEEHAADSEWKTVNGTENVRENSERQTCSVRRDE